MVFVSRRFFAAVRATTFSDFMENIIPISNHRFRGTDVAYAAGLAEAEAELDVVLTQQWVFGA